MSRRVVALTLAGLATVMAAALALPASAGPAAIPGGARVGFRAPMIVHHHPRTNLLPPRPQAYGAILQRPFVGPTPRAVTHSVGNSLGIRHNIGPDLGRRYVRHRHRGVFAGNVYPFSDGLVYGDAPYFGTPYDPSEAIPVYTPRAYAAPADDEDAAPTPRRRLVPKLSSLREDGQDDRGACRSERVTVPEAKGDGEREINIVRC